MCNYLTIYWFRATLWQPPRSKSQPLNLRSSGTPMLHIPIYVFWVIRVELSISPQDTHFTNDHWANCLAHPTWFSLVFHQQMTSFLLGFSSSFSEKTTCSNTLKSTLFSCLMLEVLDLMLRRGLQGRRIPGIVLKLALGHVNPPSWCSIVSEVGLQVGSLGFDLW